MREDRFDWRRRLERTYAPLLLIGLVCLLLSAVGGHAFVVAGMVAIGLVLFVGLIA